MASGEEKPSLFSRASQTFLSLWWRLGVSNSAVKAEAESRCEPKREGRKSKAS